jgi:multicomponent Na+:H+ antiporter subunit G
VIALFNVLAGILVLAGGAFTLIAALGALRLSDVFLRMHASTKAGTLGLGLIVVAVMFWAETPGVGAKAFAVLLFMIITAPVGAHLIGRAVWRRMSPREREAGKPDDGAGGP